MVSSPQDLIEAPSFTPPAISSPPEPRWFKKSFLTERFLFFGTPGYLFLGLAASVYRQVQKKQQTMGAPAPNTEVGLPRIYAVLLLEKEGVKYESDPGGAPGSPVFKVGPCEMKRTARGAPATMPDQPWSVPKAIPQ